MPGQFGSRGVEGAHCSAPLPVDVKRLLLNNQLSLQASPSLEEIAPDEIRPVQFIL